MNNASQQATVNKHLKSVELFCGIGGFRLACDRLAIKTIWANDINPLSCKVYRDIFGNQELREGDIGELYSTIPAHDLLTAGFPCQPFSSAGKKQGIRDPRGTLFQQIIQVLKDHSPKWFVLENVKRLLSMEHGDHFATILLALSELDYFVEWRLLKATFFGLPQNRQRLVIIGTHLANMNEAQISLASIEDLASVIKNDLSGLQQYDNWSDLAKHHKRFHEWGLCFKGQSYSCDLNEFTNSQALPSLASILEKEPPNEFFMDETTMDRIEKSVFVNRFYDGVQILYNQNGGARMGYTVFGTDGIAPTLTASHSRHYERYKIDSRYRRLTNIEYARLQGFPDNHCSIISLFNQYGLYGNAIPPPLAEWVITRLIFQEKPLLKTIAPCKYNQMRMF